MSIADLQLTEAAVHHHADAGYVRREALAFLDQMAQELDLPTRDTVSRKADIVGEIARTGSYVQSQAELEFGAKIAWRNHTRCLGKLYWRSLVVRDRRNVAGLPAIRHELVEHLRQAGNGGRVQPVLTVFAPDTPGVRAATIVNDQLLRYAGYLQADGTTVGDPGTASITSQLQALGWRGAGGRFDILPVAVGRPGEQPELFELPADVTADIAIRHPSYPWFESLGLRWYHFPTVSNLTLEIGGISYPMAPFSGWFMGAEIGTRNLGDEGRYNMLPAVARLLGHDVTSNRTLWKDRALVELNAAVLYSFEQAGIRMVDHHTLADQFHRFTRTENRAGRTVHAEWAWMVPPMSPSTMAVYHTTFDPRVLRPNFFRRTGDDR